MVITISRQNKLFFFMIAAVITAATIYLVQPYMGVIIIALISALMFAPLYERIIAKGKIGKGGATFITIIALCLTFIVPLILVANLTVSQALKFNENLPQYVNTDNVTVEFLIDRFNEVADRVPGVDYTLTEEKLKDAAEDVARPVANFVVDNALAIGSKSIALIPALILFFTLLASLIPSVRNLQEYIKNLSPLKDEIDRMYIERAVEMTKSMVKGTFLIAIAQGVMTGIFMWIAGVEYIFFLTILMIFFSILPLGSGIIAIPVGIILIATGNIWQGILVLVGNIVIAGNIDNILRPKLVSKKASLNSALVILSVLSGLKVFGFLGFIYGPVIMILFITTIEVYRKYYRD